MILTFRNPASGEQVAADDEHAPGFLEAGWVELCEGVPLDDLKAEKRAQVNALKIEKQNGNAPTSFGEVQNDDRSKGLMNGAATMALLAKMSGRPFDITWTMADNSSVALTADQMIQLGSETGAFVDSIQQYAGSLKAAIEAATSETELEGLDINAGWPG